MFKLDVETGEESEIKLPTSIGSWKKQESSRKTSTSALLSTPNPLTVRITTKCGKFWKRWEYQTTWPASWEILMQVRKQQLELDMKQQTASKSESEVSHVWLFVTPWTVAHQVPPSMEFSRQEYWSRLPFPSPGDLPNPGIEPVSLVSPHWQADSLPAEPQEI